jgi:CYTH domain-containing protein
VWEIDVFEGELLNLIIAEVELPNEDFSVVIPSWIGEEITGRHQWSNSSLARNGWP